jgi:hypothetical protein
VHVHLKAKQSTPGRSQAGIVPALSLSPFSFMPSNDGARHRRRRPGHLWVKLTSMASDVKWRTAEFGRFKFFFLTSLFRRLNACDGVCRAEGLSRYR